MLNDCSLKNYIHSNKSVKSKSVMTSTKSSSKHQASPLAQLKTIIIIAVKIEEFYYFIQFNRRQGIRSYKNLFFRFFISDR